MAESRRYIPNQQLDLQQILQEALHRWLRPAEICEILRNYKRFDLTPDPPVRPPAGSLFLFDRKALRYFRKDGHRWRKKKDGKTVKEAHEKLKAGSVDVLHCYYAHGEENENFQRRSYWMLDGQLEHIVLVHYREVKDGYKSSISHALADPGSRTESPQCSSALSFTQVQSCTPTVKGSHASSANGIGWNLQALSSEAEDVDSGGGPRVFSLAKPTYGSLTYNASLVAPEVAEFPKSSGNSPGSWFAGTKVDWPEMHGLSRNTFNVLDQKFYNEQSGGADLIAHKLTDARLNVGSTLPEGATCGDRLITNVHLQSVTASSQRMIQAQQEHDLHLTDSQFQNYHCQQMVASSNIQTENKSKDGGSNNDESGELKKLDSFGRWMDKEIGGDCDDSLMASDSGNYWNTLDTENDDKEVSSLSRHMQLDIDSLGPSLSQEQLFSIRDFSPDWAYAGVETKVLIVGTFLGSKKPSSSAKWGCMFGENEVSAEVLTDNVIRCQAPPHAHGRVPFYITCSNRLACSEVREFEYRKKLLGVPSSSAIECSAEEELCLQTRLAKLTYIQEERKWLDCSVEECDGCKLRSTIQSMRNIDETNLGRNNDTVVEGDFMDSKDKLVRNLLEERLCEWLVCKVHKGGKGPNLLDQEGLGVVHLAASVGYEWAMGPIIAAGVGPNFRDARGRTALHWASYYGREETVIKLIRLGAAPGAVDDPTSSFPGGQTAADLASRRGHKGIAGYLAEADLTSHLSSLTFNQNVLDDVAASVAAEKAIETVAQVVVASDGTMDEQLSLKGSLAAVRKSAHAAAIIQAAFRARSFRHRELTKSKNDVSEVSLDLVALGSLRKVQKLSHFEDYLHSAAIKIQQKYRGWKGRKEFLKIRNRIVKLQAHVRGHQVRKQYKKVVWSVSIVEKAILRWRRKGAGLRGFQVKTGIANGAEGTEKPDEYEFLRIGRKQKFAGVETALARVKSMVRHPEARDQYMRLMAKFENLRIGDEGSSAQQEGESSGKTRAEEDLHTFLNDH